MISGNVQAYGRRTSTDVRAKVEYGAYGGGTIAHSDLPEFMAPQEQMKTLSSAA